MRLLCVARHEYLSIHFCRVFERLGVVARPAVGLEQAVQVASAFQPDAAVCDYDLLVNVPLEAWENDALLSSVPVLAVSLTRRRDEIPLLDVKGIAGFLYLPTLQEDDARQVLAAAHLRVGIVPPHSLVTQLSPLVHPV